MTDLDYDRLKRVFDRALDLPPEQRGPFLDRECRDDALVRDALERMLEQDTVTLDVGVPKVRLSEAPEHIGNYKVLMPLGEGGMGHVYLAEQTEPLKRRVAIKVVKPGFETKTVLARFEAERQALALMNHPNIAKVLDAGATEEGRPFFVMDYVSGSKITEFCDKHRLGIAARLSLFRQVCSAVQHAHQKGVIHRDLKPSNVLVEHRDGEPVARIIDFGLARATSFRLTEQTLFTEHGQVLGTPEYMSPEQAESDPDIDTRTDVYSLGVLLYELLVGEPPISTRDLRRGALADMQRRIAESTPSKPSTRVTTLGDGARATARRRDADTALLARSLRGDLDWITMKALEKERARRYPSAAELAADIERYLADEPVSAGPPSLPYRLRKLARRHRVAVAGACGTVAALAVGLVAATWQWREATLANTRYERLADLVRLEEVRAGARGLWPEHPDRVTDMRSWLARADSLAATLPEHEEALRLQRARASSDSDTFVLQNLERLVSGLRAVQSPTGAIAQVRSSLAWAERVARETLDKPSAKRRWDKAIRVIRASAKYGDLELRPQLGLVPLQVDPESGLYEFVHLRSGDPPGRGAGGYRVGPDTGIVFVLIPGGETWIGAQSDDPGGIHYDPDARPHEGPPKRVRLEPFFLSKYEMTQAQWKRLSGGGDPSGFLVFRPSLPVIDVTWTMCDRLLHRYGLTLPAEAQWEHACRAGTTTPWWPGSELAELAAAVNVADASARGNAYVLEHEPDLSDGWPILGRADGRPEDGAPVDRRANPFGLFHVHGNVFEWCLDAGDDESSRVLRGGSWDKVLRAARSSARVATPKDQGGINVAVRPARALDPR